MNRDEKKKRYTAFRIHNITQTKETQLKHRYFWHYENKCVTMKTLTVLSCREGVAMRLSWWYNEIVAYNETFGIMKLVLYESVSTMFWGGK